MDWQPARARLTGLAEWLELLHKEHPLGVHELDREVILALLKRVEDLNYRLKGDLQGIIIERDQLLELQQEHEAEIERLKAELEWFKEKNGHVACVPDYWVKRATDAEAKLEQMDNHHRKYHASCSAYQPGSALAAAKGGAVIEPTREPTEEERRLMLREADLENALKAAEVRLDEVIAERNDAQAEIERLKADMVKLAADLSPVMTEASNEPEPEPKPEPDEATK